MADMKVDGMEILAEIEKLGRKDLGLKTKP